MNVSLTQLNALFLYASRDESLKDQFQPYLQTLQGKYVGKITYWKTDDLLTGQLAEVADKIDLVIVGLSMDLLARPVIDSSPMKKVIRYHHMRRLQIVPLFFRHYSLEKEKFRNIPRLPREDQPVESNHWSAPDEALVLCIESLRSICRERLAYKQKLESWWGQARQRDTMSGYRQFLATFPRSKYSEGARRQYEELEEAALWRQAREKDTILLYQKYLREAPLQKYRRPAAVRIVRLERSENIHREDAARLDQILTFYRYRGRFSKGKHTGAALSATDNLLKQKSGGMEEVQAEDLRGDYLHLRAMEEGELNPTERLAFTTYDAHFSTLRTDAKELREDLGWRIGYSAPFIVGMLLLFPTIYRALSFVVETEIIYAASLEEYFFRALPGLTLVFIAWRLFLWIWWIVCDIRFLTWCRDELNILSVTARTALLNYDHRRLRITLRYTRLIEDRTFRIHRKWFWLYLFQNENEDVAFRRKVPAEFREEEEEEEGSDEGK